MNAPSAAVATQTNLTPVKPNEGTRGAFRWDDPFLLDDQLTDDERLIRDSARSFAQ
jgi:glutaryl-CoA dehydrogenase